MSTTITTIEDFKAKKEEESQRLQVENAPKISGIHPERAKMLADQMNHNRIQSAERSQPTQSGLNELLMKFRRAKRFKNYSILNKVHRFDAESCIVSCSISNAEGKTLVKAHAAWDRDLIWSTQFMNCDEEEVMAYQAAANRDRLEITENLAIARALRMLGL
jgi:muconolactone delta-isomerase